MVTGCLCAQQSFQNGLLIQTSAIRPSTRLFSFKVDPSFWSTELTKFILPEIKMNLVHSMAIF